MNYEKLTWEEISSKASDSILLVPVGSIEQHGPHLPLNVDAKISSAFVKKISSLLKNTIIAPTLIFGARSFPGSGGGYLPGTISISGTLLTMLYREIIKSYINAGFKKIVFINAHWENEVFLAEAIEICKDEEILKNVKILMLSWWSLISEDDMKNIFNDNFVGWHAEHAGCAETSLMMYFYPDMVKIDKFLSCNNIPPVGLYMYPTPVKWAGNKGALSGSINSSSKYGKKLAEITVERIIQVIQREIIDE